LITIEKVCDDQIKTLKGDSIGRYSIHRTYWFDFRRANITGRTTDRAKLGAIPKVLLRKTGNSIIATYDDSGTFPEQSLYFLFNNKTDLNIKFLLGVLNSRLLNLYFQIRSLTNKESIAQVKKVDLDKLPIAALDLSKSECRQKHERMIDLVDRMLDMHVQLSKVRTDHERSALQHQIEHTDREIDQLVYELYGLSDEEIALVEGATQSG
jgi:hypothetical protein